MTKIVYNACFGGFSLSRTAILRARELSGNPMWAAPDIAGDRCTDGSVLDTDYGFCADVPRHDPILVRVVEEMGNAASGMCAALRIEEIPDGTAYRIDEYDGRESVMTAGDYEWIVP